MLQKHHKSTFFYLLGLLISLIISIPAQMGAQETNEEMDSLLWKEISALVVLDSITITPEDELLSVDSFIKYMLADESFYDAFKNLRLFEHQFEHKIRFFDKKTRLKASYEGKHHQIMKSPYCRMMNVDQQAIFGRYYKRKKYKYYTSKLIDRVFYTHGIECFQPNYDRKLEDMKGLEKQIEQLKVLIFKPGRSIKMPLIGDKLAIFSSEMREYYNYTISRVPIGNNEYAFIFDVGLKPEYEDERNVVIVRKMSTFFDAESFQVLKRSYSMKTKNLFYSFDIDILVSLTKLNSDYIPASVSYDGYWKLGAKRAEKCKFNFTFYEFKKL